MPTDWRDDPSITMRHTEHSLSFSIFYSFFLSISSVSLTILVPYKGTQFRRHWIVSVSFEATLCPVYRAYSYAVHRCIHRYSVAIPPSYHSFPLSLNPSLLYFRHSHRSALNSLSTMPAIARVVDAPTLDCRCGTTRPLRMQRMPWYLRAHCVCFSHENAIDGRLFVDASNASDAVRAASICCSALIRISICIERIGMLMYYPCRYC